MDFIKLAKNIHWSESDHNINNCYDGWIIFTHISFHDKIRIIFTGNPDIIPVRKYKALYPDLRLEWIGNMSFYSLTLDFA